MQVCESLPHFFSVAWYEDLPPVRAGSFRLYFCRICRTAAFPPFEPEDSFRSPCFHNPCELVEWVSLNPPADGYYFIPYKNIQCNCIISGDDTYFSIAAASILAKTARDKYIFDLCEENPELDEYYGIKSNKGYGAQKHRDGIMKYGISEWHRKTFGICKNY